MQRSRTISKTKGYTMAFLTQTHLSCATAPLKRRSLIDLVSLYRQRRTLAALDPTALADIGLTQEQAQSEARRPFWDFPSN